MKALDVTIHKTHLTNILLEVYKDSLLSSLLGFKGGTAAMLFYKLPRFSVDLDFDLLGKPEGMVERMTKLLSDKYTIVDSSTKFYTLFWMVSYGTGLAKIKVEVSTRDNTYNHYNLQPFYGTSVRVMDVSDMIAHKMVAVMERSTLANRDLFDLHYFLSSPYAPDLNYEVIRERTGKEPREFLQELHSFVKKLNTKNILNGLGEVLTEPQKDWARMKLRDELLGLIERNVDLL